MADKKLEKQGLMIGGPGIVMEIIGSIMMHSKEHPSLIWFVLLMVGGCMLIWGLGLTARSKGYPAIYGLLGLIGIIGLIIFAFMPDKTQDEFIR